MCCARAIPAVDSLSESLLFIPSVITLQVLRKSGRAEQAVAAQREVLATLSMNSLSNSLLLIP